MWSDAAAEVHRVVVGPLSNNVYVVRCRRTGDAALIDAAAEAPRLIGVAQALGVRLILETHGHWDHVGAIVDLRDSGIAVWVHVGDDELFPAFDAHVTHDQVVEVGDLRLRTIHPPGQILFSGETLFPGGPGATSFDGGDFPTIIRSIAERLLGALTDDVIVWPGHGAPTTVGTERPHLDE